MENADYWLAKIDSNRRRDARNNALLKKTGWRVLRFWETDIKRDPVAVAKLVKQVLASRNRRRMKST